MEKIINPGIPKLERINSGLHIVGILFGLACMPILLYAANKQGGWYQFAGATIYALSFLFVFVSSTVYHGLQHPKKKAVMQVVDHISIYFLIAGTYTPLILIYVNNRFGMTLLVILWGIALAGTIFKIWYTGKYEFLSTFIYMLMGWALFADSSAFFKSMPHQTILLLIAGGCLYSLGVIFYLWQKLTYHHVIWHIFVLAAAICHYSAVLLAF